MSAQTTLDGATGFLKENVDAFHFAYYDDIRRSQWEFPTRSRWPSATTGVDYPVRRVFPDAKSRIRAGTPLVTGTVFSAKPDKYHEESRLPPNAARNHRPWTESTPHLNSTPSWAVGK